VTSVPQLTTQPPFLLALTTQLIKARICLLAHSLAQSQIHVSRGLLQRFFTDFLGGFQPIGNGRYRCLLCVVYHGNKELVFRSLREHLATRQHLQSVKKKSEKTIEEGQLQMDNYAHCAASSAQLPLLRIAPPASETTRTDPEASRWFDENMDFSSEILDEVPLAPSLRFELDEELNSYSLTTLERLGASLQTEADTAPDILAHIGSELDDQTVSDTLGHMCA
jgi:hypothetical protein